MATSHTKLTLDGLMKDTYGDEGLVNLLPDVAIMQKRIPFKTAQKVGRDFVQAVSLTRESSFTYGAGLQTLVALSVSEHDDAKVRGAAFTLQSAFSYDEAAAMASNKQAFIDGTEFRFRAMMEAASYRNELQILHGSSGLGVADSSQDTVTAVTATKNAIIPLTAASWSAAIWAGAEGSAVSFHTTAAGVASAAVGSDGTTVNKFTIASVDTDAKTLTVICKDATEAGILVAEVEAADYNVNWFGAKGAEMVGLGAICSNTGTLYGISGAAYSLFKGNTYAAGAANFSLKKVYAAIAMAVGKGLLEDVTVVVSAATFATMANDEAALRVYNGSVKTSDRGVEGITFIGPAGRAEVVLHPLQKDQVAYIFPTKQAKRIGASDLSFKRPGSDSDMIQELPNSTGYEARLYSEQSIFIPCPAKCVVVTGISNS